MLVEQRRDLGRLVAGAHEQDRPQEVTGAPARVEPGPVAAAAEPDQHERQRRADHDFAPRGRPGDRFDREREQRGAEAAAGEALVLEHPDRAHARSVQTDRVEDRDAPDHRAR